MEDKKGVNKIKRYKKIKELGSGSFGKVYLVEDRNTTRSLFAMKELNKKKMEEQGVKKYLESEKNISLRLKHPGVIKTHKVVEDEENMYLIQEFCTGGSLDLLLAEHQKKYKKPFPEESVKHLMEQIISSVKYLHENNILHRDLKLENILVNFETKKDKEEINLMKAETKIIDFGFSKYLKKNEFASSACGTIVYMDPGIAKKFIRQTDNYKYDDKADIWSLGMLCYEMLVGHWAFNADTVEEFIIQVGKGDYTIPSDLSKETISFINDMLKMEPKQRASAAQLAKHDFLKKDYSTFTHLKNLGKKKNIKLDAKSLSNIWSMFESLDDNKLDLSLITTGKEIKDKDSAIAEVDEELGKSGTKVDLQKIEEKFEQAFKIVNNEFPYIAPYPGVAIPQIDPEIYYRKETLGK